MAQHPQPKQEVPDPVAPLHKAEAPAATLSQPQLLPQSRAPTEIAALLPPSPPASTAGKQPASGLPANHQPTELEPAACSARPSGPPHNPAHQPVVKVEAADPDACKLQPERSAVRDAITTHQRINNAALKRQASSLPLEATGGQVSQRKRQRTRSPATACRPGTQAIGTPDAAAVVPSSTRRLLPGYQRLMEGAPATGPDAAARVIAHCIDVPAGRVVPSRCQCS